MKLLTLTPKKEIIMNFKLSIGWLLFSFVTISFCNAQSDFNVDPLSPEVPGRSPSDIYDPIGNNEVITAAQLGLPDTANVDAFSYGVDKLDPLGRDTINRHALPKPSRWKIKKLAQTYKHYPITESLPIC